MRYFPVFLLVLLAACSDGAAPGGQNAAAPPASDSFRIAIEESGLANSGHPEWLVTPDSLVWTWVRPGGDHERVAHPLAAAGRDTLRARLARLDLAAIPANAQGDAPVDDMPEFNFSITANGQRKDFHLYLARIPALLDVVAAINAALPEKYGVPYNEEYLQYTP
ncbi:MAG: hypothetical protein EOO11_07620 [Chitinophagaceae bacterium]|nr:MAG: hypothetical protein EOO11_07620 [Chitinophagaceae bacterium]